jgi:hypothetical protein
VEKIGEDFDEHALTKDFAHQKTKCRLVEARELGAEWVIRGAQLQGNFDQVVQVGEAFASGWA